MKRTTIDKMINDFDKSYTEDKKNLYLDKSIDKFGTYSKEYMSKLNFGINDFEKDVFEIYFENHAKTMFRQDFEKSRVELDISANKISKKYKNMIYTTWGAIFGAIGAMGGYLIDRSDIGIGTGIVVGALVGAYFASIGIKDSSKSKTIIGTQEYDNQLRMDLYKVLSAQE